MAMASTLPACGLPLRASLLFLNGRDEIDEGGSASSRWPGHRLFDELDRQIASHSLDGEDEQVALRLEGH
jgi:hypothetical protein